MREKDIEKVLVAEVKKLGGRAYKWTSPGNDGVPDRIVIFPETGSGICGTENGYRETERPAEGTDRPAGGAGTESIRSLWD